MGVSEPLLLSVKRGRYGDLKPAMDVTKSGTRKEELLVESDILRKMYVLRRILNPMGTVDAMEFLMDKIRQTKTNSDFFDSMNT